MHYVALIPRVCTGLRAVCAPPPAAGSHRRQLHVDSARPELRSLESARPRRRTPWTHGRRGLHTVPHAHDPVGSNF